MSAKASDRRLLLAIVSVMSIIYFGIFIRVAIQEPNFDPFSYGAVVAESMFAGIFSVVGILLYIFASKRTTWKMAKSGIIGRYGRILYLAITSIILVTYALIIVGFIISYLSVEEKEKMNQLIGLLLVGMLAGLFVYVYMRHVFVSKDGIPSKYKRHPAIFSPTSNEIPK